MPAVYLITKNKGKLMTARKAFDRFNIELMTLNVSYPEIQADSSIDVARHTALLAAKENGVDVIREDHSLVVNALGENIPGPYANYITRKMPLETLLKIIKLFGNNTGYFDINAVYAHPDGRYLEYSFKVPIRFSDTPKGDEKQGWNRVIMLEGENRTLTEYPETDRVDVFNRNFVRIAEDIINGK